ncbi:MAG: sensor histidine kinase [Clostridiaceae bacterium]|nr:sensor histidine kinase [Clostridiaceae bacterium]
MNNQKEDLHVIVMYILAFWGLLIIVLSNLDALWMNLLIALSWLFFFTLRNLYIYKIDKYRILPFFTYAIEIILLCFISIYGAGDSTKLLLYITIADCYIAYGILYGTLCAVVAFVFFVFQFFFKVPIDIKYILSVIGKEAPAFMLVGLISYLMGQVLKSKTLIVKSMRETEIREVELKVAYDELSRAYENLEEMSALKERNRISREIHDTVGHTITTVIVEMEAGRMLAAKDARLALEKFSMAHSQALKALEELRGSVRLLSKRNEITNLSHAVLEAVKETEKHADVKIKSLVEVPEDIEQEVSALIIRILKEGLSNGIRHGGATAFILKLLKEKDNLFFLLQDNGKGCISIFPGFGLNNMKKSIFKLDGHIEFISEQGEGFEIKIFIPLRKVVMICK